MAIDDIQDLHKQSDKTFLGFEKGPLPGELKYYRRIPIPCPESAEFHDIEKNRDLESQEACISAYHLDDPNPELYQGQVRTSFPGALSNRSRDESGPPSPDEIAFYLPFHFYDFDYPPGPSRPWGIYLLSDRMQALTALVYKHAQPALNHDEAFRVSQIFLSGIQAFHHTVESFATRLEITHRTPVYKDAVTQLFTETQGTSMCKEEALAAAHGLQRVQREFKHKQRAYAIGALEQYLEGCPPGYNRGKKFLKPKVFKDAQNEFAEEIHKKAFSMPEWPATLWSNFPHAFHGIGRVNSRVNYLVPRHSFRW